jgi:hypothetical protein
VLVLARVSAGLRARRFWATVRDLDSISEIVGPVTIAELQANPRSAPETRERIGGRYQRVTRTSAIVRRQC